MESELLDFLDRLSNPIIEGAKTFHPQEGSWNLVKGVYKRKKQKVKKEKPTTKLRLFPEYQADEEENQRLLNMFYTRSEEFAKVYVESVINNNIAIMEGFRSSSDKLKSVLKDPDVSISDDFVKKLEMLGGVKIIMDLAEYMGVSEYADIYLRSKIGAAR
jgi:hypothetical protein